jgi:kynurenine formamidase
MSELPSYDQLRARTDAPPGSVWGLFGDGDQLGTINFLTPERVLAAARCIRRGTVFNLDVPLDTFDPPLTPVRHTLKHSIFQRNPFHRDEWVDGFYLQAASQIDGLRHMGNPDHGFYGGAPGDSLQPGDPLLSISHWADHGIVGRGVLVDVARYLEGRGEPIDYRTNQAIPISVIDAAAEKQGVSFEPGDIVLLRFGYVRFYREETTPEERAELPRKTTYPGLLQAEETVAWLWDHRFSLLAADNFAVEAWPPDPATPFVARSQSDANKRTLHTGTLHQVILPLLGMPLGELWDLDALAEDCADDGVYEFMLVAKPLNLIGGVGSPANAVAIK